MAVARGNIPTRTGIEATLNKRSYIVRRHEFDGSHRGRELIWLVDLQRLQSE
jgi:hypothetical protein